MNTPVAFAAGAGALLGVFAGHTVGKALTRGRDPTIEAFSTAVGALGFAALAAGLMAPPETTTSTAVTTTTPSTAAG